MYMDLLSACSSPHPLRRVHRRAERLFAGTEYKHSSYFTDMRYTPVAVAEPHDFEDAGYNLLCAARPEMVTESGGNKIKLLVCITMHQEGESALSATLRSVCENIKAFQVPSPPHPPPSSLILPLLPPPHPSSFLLTPLLKPLLTPPHPSSPLLTPPHPSSLVPSSHLIPPPISSPPSPPLLCRASTTRGHSPGRT
jgi:hypothetical protein